MTQSDFLYYNGTWIRKNELTHSERITRDFANKLLSRGGLYVRDTINFDKSGQTSFWYVIKDAFGGIEELPTKVRNQVRKSLKTYEFRRVSIDVMLENGCELFNKSRERFGEGQKITQEQWKNRLLRDKGSEYLDRTA